MDTGYSTKSKTLCFFDSFHACMCGTDQRYAVFKARTEEGFCYGKETGTGNEGRSRDGKCYGKETGTGNEGLTRDGKVDESRAGTRLDGGRETERKTGTMLSRRDKRMEQKRTDGFVEVLRRGVRSS